MVISLKYMKSPAKGTVLHRWKDTILPRLHPPKTRRFDDFAISDTF